MLRNLADSAVAEQVVFKGGTSLSKGYGLIKRFSEDGGLAVILQEQQSGGALKKLIREIHKNAAGDLPEVEITGLTSKRGHNRLVYQLVTAPGHGPGADCHEAYFAGDNGFWRA